MRFFDVNVNSMSHVTHDFDRDYFCTFASREEGCTFVSRDGGGHMEEEVTQHVILKTFEDDDSSMMAMTLSVFCGLKIYPL